MTTWCSNFCSVAAPEGLISEKKTASNNPTYFSFYNSSFQLWELYPRQASAIWGYDDVPLFKCFRVVFIGQLVVHNCKTGNAVVFWCLNHTLRHCNDAPWTSLLTGDCPQEGTQIQKAICDDVIIWWCPWAWGRCATYGNAEFWGNYNGKRDKTRLRN